MSSIEETIKGLRHISRDIWSTYPDTDEDMWGSSAIKLVAERSSLILASVLVEVNSGKDIDSQLLADSIKEELGMYFPND